MGNRPATLREGYRVNVALVAVVLLTHAFALFAVPLFLLERSAWWGLALALPAAVSGTLWSLIHEAIHDHLLPARAANDRAGRGLAVLHGAAFRLLRIGHLTHHRYSRSARERIEVYDSRRISRTQAAAGYYPHIVGGLYAAEVLGTLASLLPKKVLARLARRLDTQDTVAGIITKALCRQPSLGEARRDALAVVVLYGASAALFGAYAWMLALALGARAFFVSIADNAYHYGTALDRRAEARNLFGPLWLDAALLDFTLHGVHHAHPALPWFELRRRFNAEGGNYDGAWIDAVLAQLAGPIPSSAFSAPSGPEAD